MSLSNRAAEEQRAAEEEEVKQIPGFEESKEPVQQQQAQQRKLPTLQDVSIMQLDQVIECIS